MPSLLDQYKLCHRIRKVDYYNILIYLFNLSNNLENSLNYIRILSLKL